jgi:hypothetical protein
MTAGIGIDIPVFNWGKRKIKLKGEFSGYAERLWISHLHAKDDGAHLDTPSFCFELSDGRSFYTEISLETLRTALAKAGYSLKRKGAK